jgi:putative FmdB family regulatory protein
VPLYEYECKDCGHVCEEIRGFNDAPPKCECGGKTERIMSTFAMTHGKTNAHRAMEDKGKRAAFIRADLKENHGVHTFKPLKNSEGRDFEQVYKDIKKMGGKVKDEIQANSEKNNATMKKKQRKWMEGALKRTDKKREQMIEERKKEAHNKNHG